MSYPLLKGFTILRNGLKYDYPFRESLRGLQELCGSVVVALGKSNDGTENAVASLGVELIPTIWDENQRQGGTILSEQTNIARQAAAATGAKWGFYLQADEAISELDYDLIRSDLARAEAEGCDVISFRYLHFWQSYERIAVGKRWYPQEIRCIRLDTTVESYGDAQSFCGWRKRYESEAVIYHYGHVREAAAYERKKKDFHRWWHKDSELTAVIARGEKGDQREDTLAYLGPHPYLMRERIRTHGGAVAKTRRRVAVLGDRAQFSEDFLSVVDADLVWLQDERKIFEWKPEDVVLLRNPAPFTFILSMGKLKSRVPRAMRSPQARPWTKEFQAMLRFSERSVWCRAPSS